MSGSQDDIPPPPPPLPSSSQTPTQQTPHTVSTIKLPILKKGEYDIWALKMEHYLAHTDYPIWEVIQNGNGLVSITTDTSGQINVLPPRTAEEIVARERERKARTTLLMALPEDHLAKFHKMTDAKEMWDAIKSRFGGNDESKKMQKYILKQQFEGFFVSNTEGLHKGYDRSLPSAWSQVSLIMRIKPGVDSLSYDDLYNNLRFFKSDIKGSTASSSSSQNVAFVSENTSSTNEVSTAYCVPNLSGQNSKYEQTSSYSLLANQSSCPQLDHEDLEQIDEYDLEEMDLKWQVAMISMRMKKFYKKTRRKLQFDAKEPVGFDKTKLNATIATRQGILLESVESKELKITGGGMHGILGTRMGAKLDRRKIVKYCSDSDTEDYPHRALKNKGIVDSGCSRHMTWNKAYLAEFQDFNGGPVAFGEFHEIIDFLKRSSIYHALTVCPIVSTTFVEQFWTSAKSKIINNVRHITTKVAGKSVSISEALIRSDLLFDDADGIDSLSNQAIFDAIQLMGEVPIEQKTSLSARPSPTTFIPDSIPETSGGNLGGHSSSDKSLSGDEDQAKEIQHLKAQITKLKKQAKPVITHHRAWLKSVSLKQRLTRKRFSKKQRVHKESVSKQRRKFVKGESSVQGNPLFDELPEDIVDHMETKNAQDEGRTRDIVDEDKEIKENILSTEDVLSTDKKGVSTDKEKVSTDRSIVSTDGSKVSTDRQIEGTDDQIESTDEQIKGTEDHTEEGSVTQATQTPASIILGDDETIAKVLLNMSQAKAVSREKEKGVELKDIEETKRPRPTSTRSLLTLKPLPKIDLKDKGKKKIEEEDESKSESDGILEAEKKFKQLESDEEMDRKIQEEWEGEEERNRIAEEKATNEALIRNFDDITARIEADRLLAERIQKQEREQFTIEEREKFLHDTIATQRKFLAQKRSKAIRNRPPTKNQLRNQMMTYLKHVGNFKHAELKIKKFEEIQALYEKIKRSDEDFISIRSAEDERLIKRMNEKGVDSSKSEVIKEENKEEAKEENKEEESTRKRKLGTRKKIKSRKRRYIQNTSEDDKWRTECLGTKPQDDKAEHLEEINQNVVIRSNGQKRYFSTLMRVLSIFDREDLKAVYELVMDRYQDEIPEGFDRVLWGDLMVMFNPDDEDEFWNS
ncbi:hypothetical protein Tco_1386343 [Tanacetum coccineum]